MPVELGSRGQADFSEPIELMMDCHRRVEHFLGVLRKVVDSASGGPLDPEHREALETALNYFKQGAPRHTEDEEQSLFPRMRESGSARAQEALAKIESLEADHRRAEPAHARIDELGRQWLANDALPTDAIAELDALLGELERTYAEHIATEDEQVFPAAREALAAEQLQAVGQEMKRRRELDPGRPGSRCADRRARLSG